MSEQTPEEAGAFPVAPIKDSTPDKLTCPECSQTFESNLRLGAHRFHKHGVSGSAGHKKKDKKAPTSNAPKSKAKEPSDAVKRRRLETEARETLKRWRAEAGTVGLVIAPIPATYIARTDDEVIEAAVRLAGKNAKILEGLAAGGDVIAAIVVLRWLAGLGVAVGVQYGRVEVASTLAQRTGVTEVVVALEREGFVEVEPVEPEGSEDANRAADEGEPVGVPSTPAVALV